ncbi:MAG: protein kinase [Candidatus Obscuribacterales bacterium]|nr:protein kinase [Candidatus Obscuribacterales bacterium]
MQSLQPGTIIDNSFEIKSHIGDGGMGTVYRAVEISLARPVAIKFINLEMLSDEESRERFKQEGKILSSLKHKNIPVFYRFGLYQNCWPYLAMELLEGESLQSLLANCGSLGWQRSLLIAVQICDAMEAAHQQGIIHRDLKPGNIILVKEQSPDFVKVLDFGLSKIISSTDSNAQSLTKTGFLLGTVNYMSPEQCSGQKADERSDIYSLACIVFEAISGTLPFQSENSFGLIHKHLNEPAARLSSHFKEGVLPENLDEVLQKAMAKKPEHRYQSMKDFARDLQAILDGQGAELEFLKPDNKSGKNGGNSNQKNLLYVLSIALLAIFLLIAFKLISKSSTVPQLQKDRKLSALGLQAKLRILARDQSKQSLAFCKTTADEIIENPAKTQDLGLVFDLFRILNDKFSTEHLEQEQVYYANAALHLLAKAPPRLKAEAVLNYAVALRGKQNSRLESLLLDELKRNDKIPQQEYQQLGMLNHEYALCLANTGNNLLAAQRFEKAAKYLNAPELKIENLKSAAITYNRAGKSEDSKKTVLQILELVKAGKANLLQLAELLEPLAGAGLDKEYVDLLEKAENRYHQTEDHRALFSIYQQRAILDLLLNKPENAEKYLKLEFAEIGKIDFAKSAGGQSEKRNFLLSAYSNQMNIARNSRNLPLMQAAFREIVLLKRSFQIGEVFNDYIEQTRTLNKDGRQEAAIECLEELKKVAEKQSKAQLRKLLLCCVESELGDIYEHAGKFDLSNKHFLEARRIFDSGIEPASVDEFPGASYSLAWLYKQLEKSGDLKKAEQVIELALKTSTKAPGLHQCILGDLILNYGSQMEAEKARKVFQENFKNKEILSLDRISAEILLAEAFLRCKKTVESKALCEELRAAMEAEPKLHPQMLLLLARLESIYALALAIEAKSKEAHKHYARALEYSMKSGLSEDNRFYYEAATQAAACKLFREAHHYLNLARKHCPAESFQREVDLAEGDIYFKEKRMKEALNAYKKAFESSPQFISPSTAWAAAHIGDYLKEKKDYAAAQSYYKNSIEIFTKCLGAKSKEHELLLKKLEELKGLKTPKA